MWSSNSIRLSALFCAAALTLPACATTAHGKLGQSATFGEAVKHNIAMQTVAPTEAQKENTFIPADPTRQKLARDNYKSGEVPEPEIVRTTD